MWTRSHLLEVTTYAYGAEGLIWSRANGEYQVYHYDYRGSVIAVTDEDGNITDTITYTAYGKQASRTGTSKLIFGYNGRYGVLTDPNGLLYMRTRYYSPDFKRFMSADIIDGSIADSTTLNLYAYVNGNPISFVDPFGLNRDEVNKNTHEITWESASPWVHTALDIAGFVPLFGVVPDAINAVIYLFEGDWVNFGFSALAVIPVAEYFSAGGKVVSNGAKIVDGASDTVKTVDKVYDTYKSINNASDALKLANGSPDALKELLKGFSSDEIAKIATTGTPNEVGQIGELLAKIDSNVSKTHIVINNRTRIPDILTRTTLTEVKNVKSISNTQQLKDFADYAKQPQIELVLKVRPNTHVSQSVRDAGWKIDYLW